MASPRGSGAPGTASSAAAGSCGCTSARRGSYMGAPHGPDPLAPVLVHRTLVNPWTTPLMYRDFMAGSVRYRLERRHGVRQTGTETHSPSITTLHVRCHRRDAAF